MSKITSKDIKKATEILQRYKAGKANLDRRIVENEQWWKLRQWEIIRNKEQDENKSTREPASAWMFNMIANKHADAMDNYPEPNALPRAEDDKETAEILSKVLPTILDQNNYEQIYNDTWWYKLKQGTGVKGIFWNKNKLNGLGDIDIRKMDILNLFWEPGITDIQQSRHFFSVELVDNEYLKEQYPTKKIDFGDSHDTAKYIYDDTVDTSEKSQVIDWYYKKNGVLHYVKFVNNTILYASENEEDYKDRGFYDHGQYPFVFDVLFMQEGTPAGFGYIDIAKETQERIDRLNAAIIQNAQMASKRRYFVRDDGTVDEKEFSDWKKDIVHVSGNLDDLSIREITTTTLDSIYVSILNNMIEELKDTSGNRDFSNGGTTSGVTSGSAIAALQEAGGKMSRDMIKSAYRTYQKECYLIIELIRQFYDMPRYYRITGKDGRDEYIEFDNQGMQSQNIGGSLENILEDNIDEIGDRKPVFDIVVYPAKKSAYSRMSQNELALQFYNLGFFNPEMVDQALVCIDMMDFENKEELIRKLNDNKTMYDKLQEMTNTALQLATIVDAMRGTNIAQNLLQGTGGNIQQTISAAGGLSLDEGNGSQADKARMQSSNVANPS